MEVSTPKQLAVSVIEAARLMSVNPRTVERWIEEGKLNSAKLGESRRSRRVVRVSDLENFLAERMAKNCQHDKE